jgi:hypothetical protein
MSNQRSRPKGRSLKKKTTHKTTPAMSVGEVKSIVHRVLKQAAILKYFDTLLVAANSTSTVGFQNMSLVPQGVAQSQRVADTIRLQYMDLRMSVNAANTDVFSHMRFFFFIWKENTLYASPSSLSIFTSPAIQGIYTTLEFENRALRKLVTKDTLLRFTGTVTNPTTQSQQDAFHRIQLKNSRLDFTFGATSGYGHLFFVNYSDSQLTPFPVYTLLGRIYYFDDGV